jgi:hypothetical protein
MAQQVRLSGGSLQTVDGVVIDSSMIDGAAASADVVPAIRSVNTQTDDYTLLVGDANATVEMNKGTANTLTVPNGVFSAGHEIKVVQVGAGATTIADDGTSTVNVDGALTLVLNGQWAVATIYCRGSDVFVVSGDLTAV